MALEIINPTISPARETISYAPRPKSLQGLKVGLVENTKHNSDVLLLKIADRLNSEYGMEMVSLYSKKSASDYLSDEAIADLKQKADFAIAGIGD